MALADYYVWSGRQNDALRVLNQLTTRDEEGAARTRIASILYDRGDREKAAGVVDQVLERDRSSVTALLLKARMALDAHDTARAREFAQQAAAVSPESSAVHDMLVALAEAER